MQPPRFFETTTAFRAQPAGYRHKAAWHVASAKRPEVRAARLARLIEASQAGLRL